MPKRVTPLLTSLVLVATLGLAMPGRVGASASPRTPNNFLPAADVPWSSVGAGWVLAQWNPRDNPRAVGPSYLVLVSPVRVRYLLWHVASPHALLTAWSPDGRRALVVTQGARTTFQVLDVRNGATVSSFTFPTSNNVFYENAGFTRPDGLALLVSTQTNDHQLLARYSLSGALEQTYPASFPGLGRVTGTWLSAPDGTSIVLGAAHGLFTVSNAGAVQSTDRVLGDAGYCNPQRWWSATAVLASCGTGAPRLYEFLASGARRALTRPNVAPDNGDLSAWRLGASVYVQVASACGYEYLAKLHGTDPVRVKVPGVELGHSVEVVGTTASSLAVEASIACQPGQSLLFFDPAANKAPDVLGRPVTSGYVEAALVYPPARG